MMYLSLIFMLLILSITLGIIIRFSFIMKSNIMHNKCHTDNMKIEDLHGHTEPHV